MADDRWIIHREFRRKSHFSIWRQKIIRVFVFLYQFHDICPSCQKFPPRYLSRVVVDRLMIEWPSPDVTATLPYLSQPITEWKPHRKRGDREWPRLTTLLGAFLTAMVCLETSPPRLPVRDPLHGKGAHGYDMWKHSPPPALSCIGGVITAVW